jgi:hypothetical protein
MSEEILAQVEEIKAAPVGGFNLGDLMIDEGVSKKGVWVDWIGGTRLLLASTSSTKYKSKLSKLARDNKLILDDANPDNFMAIQRITCQALAEEALLGWEGIHWPDEAGNVTYNIPYSPKLGQEALMKVDALRSFVSEESAKPSHFKKEVAEEAKKP